jgi:nucleoside-diphosphate-sugar epimerase
MATADKILVIGSSGQIGTELVEELRKQAGKNNVIASDLKEPLTKQDGPFETLDALDEKKLTEVIKKHQVSQVYLLAALLSATAEQHVKFAWKLNMEGLFNILDLAKEKVIKKIFWPSSIAVFGPGTPRECTPQNTIMDPTTVYGISKLAGERWCEYYFLKYGADVRSLRYPGLIGYKSAPGGGTTDYAVHIFHEAISKGSYECFLSENTTLPMMYMPDAIKATIDLMEAPSEKIKIKSSYNLAGISFSPRELAAEIKKFLPDFKCTYKPDARQIIANSWPKSIDDSAARNDWGWNQEYSLGKMTEDMIKNIRNH